MHGALLRKPILEVSSSPQIRNTYLERGKQASITVDFLKNQAELLFMGPFEIVVLLSAT